MRWLAALLVLATPVAAVTCEDIEHLGASFTVCEVNAAEDLQLFLRDSSGTILGSFAAVEDHAGRDLLFAMNAGMYHDDRRAVGLYVEDGVSQQGVISSDGPGNFGLLPNGVFCIGVALRVIETLNYVANRPVCIHATQSGPMLVIDGELHPRFIPNGSSRNIRNGVGTYPDGNRAVFAISNEPVNFHDFATLFRDRLKTDNALFLDGSVSRLYAPSLNRFGFGFNQLGPIVGVLAPVDGDNTNN